ncbi:PAS domain-containing protein [Dongia deserti]|uniref:PAS domain-containing protein n=1 Tax=Dongia deserti TaxID=2268030 RepID=UPI000E6497C9
MDRIDDRGCTRSNTTGKRQGRFAPSRSDIEPLDLVPILPRIMLADVIPDPLDFRYRLSGTAIADVHGTELTGLAPRDLKPSEYGRLIDGHYRQCVMERRPLMHLIMLDSARLGDAGAVEIRSASTGLEGMDWLSKAGTAPHRPLRLCIEGGAWPCNAGVVSRVGEKLRLGEWWKGRARQAGLRADHLSTAFHVKCSARLGEAGMAW